MKLATFCLIAAASVGGMESTGASAGIIDPGLSGIKTFSQWDFTTLNNDSGAYGTFAPNVSDGLTFGWSVAGNVAGSNPTPLFNKIAGGNGIVYAGTLYVGYESSGNFSVTMTPADPNVNKVVFQLVTGDGSDETNLLNNAWPVLSYKQDATITQATPTATQSDIIGTAPTLGHDGNVNETLWTLDWDLSGVGPVDSYEIDWGMVIHSQMLGARLDQSAVPEPASLALLGLGGVLLIRRRRR